MVSGMNTLGEKVTRRPCASSRAAPASATRSTRGVCRRSSSESIEANLGGVTAGGAIDEPHRRACVHPRGRDVVAPAAGAATASALAAPSTVNTARRAELIAGRVRVRRGWGFTPLGSSVATTRSPGPASRLAAPGKSDAVWPSGPRPRWIRSIPGPVTSSATVRWYAAAHASMSPVPSSASARTIPPVPMRSSSDSRIRRALESTSSGGTKRSSPMKTSTSDQSIPGVPARTS